MQTRSLLFAVTALALAACQDDMSVEKATWETTTKGWEARMDKMKKGHEELAARVKAFVVPPSEAALVADKAAVDKSIETGTTAITNAEHEMASAKTTMDGLFSQGKKVRVEVALGNTKNTVDGTLSRAESLISAANSSLESLAKKVASVKASGDALKSRTDALRAELKKKGASVQADDVVFNGESVDAERSRVELGSLVTALKSCPDLKVELAVSSLGEQAAELGVKRAEALKTWLTANGVPAATLSKVSGGASTDGDENVSFLVATPCK